MFENILHCSLICAKPVNTHLANEVGYDQTVFKPEPKLDIKKSVETYTQLVSIGSGVEVGTLVSNFGRYEVPRRNTVMSFRCYIWTFEEILVVGISREALQLFV